jgi:hypothetical protein
MLPALAARNINTTKYHDLWPGCRHCTHITKLVQIREGRTSIEHKKRVQSHPTVNYRVLEQRFRRNPNVSLRELAKDVCSHEAARKWHQRMGRRPIRTQFVPYRLNPKRKGQRVDLSSTPPNPQKRSLFQPTNHLCVMKAGFITMAL